MERQRSMFCVIKNFYSLEHAGICQLDNWQGSTPKLKYLDNAISLIE